MTTARPFAAMLAAACMLLGLASPAHAVYRCEANGKITYSDEPCHGGKSTVLDIQESPQSRDADHAQQRLANDKKELQRLQNARRKEEEKQAREHQKLAKASQTKREKCQNLALRLRWSQEDASRATGKSAEKAALKARRMAEKHDLECGKG